MGPGSQQYGWPSGLARVRMHAMMQFGVKPIQGAVMSNVQCARVRSNAAERKIRGSVHSVQVVHGVRTQCASCASCATCAKRNARCARLQCSVEGRRCAAACIVRCN